MKKQLSILLPTYNCRCVELVQELHRQCEEEQNLTDYEIIVADDCSSEQTFVVENSAIEELYHVSYIKRTTNIGRSAIRNFLASLAHYEWLLYIDGDLSLSNPNFISNYLSTQGLVIVGGIEIENNDDKWKDNLRYRYERKCEALHNAFHRQQHPTKEFRTTNFLISKQVIQECPFDEHFKHYGYEDVLFGKNISQKGYNIVHIDNPILLNDFEDNYHFLLKIEESCRTLFCFRNELQGYSTLIDYAQKLSWLQPLIKKCYPLFGLHIKSKIICNKPSVLWFNIYKLLYYIHLS